MSTHAHERWEALKAEVIKRMAEVEAAALPWHPEHGKWRDELQAVRALLLPQPTTD